MRFSYVFAYILLWVTTDAESVPDVKNSNDLPLTCQSPVYCYGKLLETVQTVRPKLFNDSKTFVDMHMIYSQNETLANFDKMMKNSNSTPTRAEIKKFVSENFDDRKELENATLADFKDKPAIIDRIKDDELKTFVINLNKIWKELARKIIKDVHDSPEKHSIEPLPYPFVIPGGRFKEPYYWDSLWIITGLLICDMPDTSRHMIENFFWLIDKYGFVPNGARIYYTKRSQPPLLMAMVAKYIKYTNDYEWLEKNLKYLEKELTYWLDYHAQDVEGHTLLRYYAPSQGPRPESFREDIETAKGDINKYIELKSAAESGWDFSSRWFWTSDHNYSLNLADIDISHIIPVDLNAYFCGAVLKLVEFYSYFNDASNYKKWNKVLNEFRRAIYRILWNEEEKVWFDYHFLAKKHKKQFFPTNISPLWTQCLTDEQNITEIGDEIVAYLERNGVLKYPGGIPASLNNSGEQWDYPNVWPCMQTIVIEGLELSGSKKALKVAFKLTEKYVRSNLLGFKTKNAMYEKYDAENFGERGGGGEYEIQKGFGWTNGAVLDMIQKYAGMHLGNLMPNISLYNLI